MKYGVVIFPTAYSIQPADLAHEAEARGFESIWFPEHTHIPCSRATPWPGGAELPRMYYDTYDLFVALSFAAAATTKIKIASGICLLIERDPITTAKEVASIDKLSDGRFLFGIGGGWNVEEMANHGTAFDTRWKVLRERLEAMKVIWREEKAEYHGEFVDFDPIYSWPKPTQKPHPPIHIGGAAPWALRRCVRYADGWMPIGMRDEVTDHIPTLRRMAKEAGRKPESIEVSVYYAPADADAIKRYADAGVARAIFGIPSEASRDAALTMLDNYARIAGLKG